MEEATVQPSHEWARADPVHDVLREREALSVFCLGAHAERFGRRRANEYEFVASAQLQRQAMRFFCSIIEGLLFATITYTCILYSDLGSAVVRAVSSLRPHVK